MTASAILSAEAAAPFVGRRVLFTGGSGFVGCHAVRQALAAGVEAHLLGRRPGPDGSVFHAVDLLDREAVDATVRAVAPAAVIHLAAPGVAYGSTGLADMLDVVVRGTEALLTACAALPKPPVVVQVGSGFEYAPADLPVSEMHPVVPSGSLYGTAKAVGSVIAGGFAATLPLAIVRPFHLYGAGEAPARLGPFLIRKALARERVDLTALQQQRDCLHVDDCARALWETATHLAGKRGLTVLNLGSGEPITLRRFVEELVAALAVAGYRADIRIGSLPYRANEPMVSLPDLARLHATLAWRPRIGLRDGIDDLVRWSIATWA